MIMSRTTIAVPPGATIKEQLEDRGMSQKEFAARMDMSEKHISRLINGEVQLTPDMARRLEMVLGLPAHFWSGLESLYREKLIKVQAENDMDADIETARKIPYNEMAKNGWIAATRNGIERVVNLRKFFEVVNLGLIGSPAIAFRKLGEGEKSNYALLAWAQEAKLEARETQTAPINIAKLRDLIPDIRRMTTQSPEVFCPALRDALASCGVAVVFLPHLSGSFLHGATFYDGGKIVLGVTVRGKDADRFWFSLFHELGHIILGHLGKEITKEDEEKADAFATDALIPPEEFLEFTTTVYRLDESHIVKFAERLEIDPGIVLGRLQKEGLVPYNKYGGLKTKYEIG